MQRLWHKTEMHVIFHEYHLFFSIRDIDAAMQYLHEIKPGVYDNSSHLDSNKLYATELEERNMEYMNELQPLMQNKVGVYLLMRGRAYIEDRKHHKITKVLADISEARETNGMYFVQVNFYDPRNHQLLFAGNMNVELQHKLLDF
jgi:hypothetical protein